ncbi:pseudouridine synthase [Bacteroidia bacterium]|nr:pseudouridine synthase [Bacteroidia bacterium]
MQIISSKKCKLIELVEEEFGESSKTHIRKIIKKGFISINGESITNPETIIDKGTAVEYTKYASAKTQKVVVPFKIVYEDSEIIIVVKPAGIISVGGFKESKKSMFVMVRDYVQKKNKEKLFAVHRLDREVSGLILFAKDEKTKGSLIKNWDKTTKRYLALVENPSAENSDFKEIKNLLETATLKDYIAEGPKQKMLVVPSMNFTRYGQPQLAVTKYKKISDIGKYTLLDLELQTGRKNQLRLQLSNLGHPIVGDRKYGAEARYLRQIRLMAYYISIQHPKTKERLTLEIPMPKSFTIIKNMDENYTKKINPLYKKV